MRHTFTFVRSSLIPSLLFAHIRKISATRPARLAEPLKLTVKRSSVRTLLTLLFVLVCHCSIDAQGQTNIFGPEKYTHEESTPQTVTRVFSVKDPKGAFSLSVEKGIGETAGTASVVIKLNGETLMNGELTRQTIIKSITLKRRNKITVELSGQPGSSIVLTIAPPVIYTLYTHPAEPRLMRAEFPDGKLVEYFGTKNSEGTARSLSSVSVTAPNGDLTTYAFDAESRIVEIQSPNGVKLKFKWDSVTTGVVTLISPDGLNQVSAPVDFSHLSPTNSHAHHFQPISFSFDSSPSLLDALEHSLAPEPISGQSVCVAAAKLISKACFVIRGGLGLPGASAVVCTALSGAIAYTGVGVALLPFVAESCPTVLLAVKTVCLIEAVGDLNGNADAICTKIHNFVTTVTNLVVGKRLGAGSALILKEDKDDGSKIPLILIHGIHGGDGEGNEIPNIKVPNKYWDAFGAKFNAKLKATYVRYVFQYFSDAESVPQLATHLGQEIDAQLAGRPHVLLAHSMGGLVAKSYMVNYRHRSGRWAGSSGGDSTNLLITLATPHHGTPAANDSDAIDRYMRSDTGWETVFNTMNILYWTAKAGFVSPPTHHSDKYNRSDLRWDNYDHAIAPNVDANVWLSQANGPFRSLSSKVIAYAGSLRPSVGRLTPTAAAKKIAAALNYDKHQKLAFANDVMYYGLDREFGISDGMVPYESALLCDSGTVSNGASNTTITCSSPTRVRKFESGPKAEFAGDAGALSITRRPGGYDHLDMLEDSDVLNWVVKDLLGANVVVSTSLQVAPGKGPYSIGQKIGGTFSITNRGSAELDTKQVLIAGRVEDGCPNRVCPDFTVRDHIKLAPGQTYNYSGNFTPSLAGHYTFSVAYQTPDDKWVIPVDTEKGTMNKLELVVQLPPPTLTRSAPSSLGASPNAQTVNLYGTGLSRILYCWVQFPNGKGTFIYIPLSQVKGRSDTQLETKIKFVSRGTYYITAFVLDNGRSNALPIVVN